MPSFVICRDCGAQAPFGAEVCPGCGHSLSGESAPMPPPAAAAKKPPPKTPEKKKRVRRPNTPCPVCGALMFKHYVRCRECGGYMDPTMPEQIKAVHEEHRKHIVSSMAACREELGSTKGIWIFRMDPNMDGGDSSHFNWDGKEFDLATGMWDPSQGRHVLPGELPKCFCEFDPVIGPRKPRP